MKLLVTGGHVTPALACIQKARQKYHQLNVVFVGRQFANTRERIETFEYQEVKKIGIKFISLHAGRLTRSLSIRTLENLWFFPLGFISAWQILQSEKPDAVLSFGGYLGLPVAFCAWLQHIPIFTHEQTINPGLANRLISCFAKKTFIAFPQTSRFFPTHKTIYTGNPVRAEIFRVIRKPFVLIKTHPVIYITGGSLGAHQINCLIENLISALLQKYIVIHQTGNIEEYADYTRLIKIRNKLPAVLKERYFLAQHFFAEEIGYIYSISDLVVARAGANTFFELLSCRLPAIFIPLPWSAHDEQKKQAQIFKDQGLGESYEGQDHIALLNLINKTMAQLTNYRQNFNSITSKYDQPAAEIILKTIFQK